MTCQHCQTWVGELDHRCPRCGRRVRAVPSRISPSTYPIAASATAHAYDFEVQQTANPSPPVAAPKLAQEPILEANGQQVLFTQPVNSPRVIAFESYAGQGAAAQRPAPVRTGKVELRRPRAAKRAPAKHAHKTSYQTALDFQTEASAAPRPAIICDVPVASYGVRLRAATLDAAWMIGGGLAVLLAFRLSGGHFSFDKNVLPYVLVAFFTVPLFYKAFWAIAGAETPGMRSLGLRLVDFDGNPPAPERRCYRALGSALSVFAAGIGLFWSLVDEDALTWHDHISGTFPTSNA